MIGSAAYVVRIIAKRVWPRRIIWPQLPSFTSNQHFIAPIARSPELMQKSCQTDIFIFFNKLNAITQRNLKQL